MGSQRKMSSAPLLAPQAMACALTNDTKPAESWYSIKALSRGVAEILLYDEIGAWGITAQQFARELKALGDLSLISLRVHSPGGDVFEGTAIYNLLKHHPARVEGYVDGLAASMATVVLMSCDVIHIPENAMMMVHRPWGIQGGEADDMRRYADLLEKIEGTMVAAYMAKTGKSEEDIKALLKAETWMDGREAVEAGFADQLTEPLAAAAQLTSKRMKEFAHMPEALKALMQPRASTPAAAAPTPSPAAPTSQPAPAAPDEAAVRAQINAAENTRREGIRAVFQPFAASHGEMLNEVLLDSSVTIEQAQAKLLASLASGATPSAGPSGSQGANSHVYAGNGNLVGDSVRASVMARAGLEEQQSDNRYNFMSLRELARASLVDRGIGVASYSPMQMVGLAFTHTTSDFGTILIDVANRSMLAGWDEAEETFQLWTKKGMLSDFKTVHRVGLGEFPSLRQVREGAEYKYVTVGSRSQPIALATYGEIFSITRQAIINDDMNLLTDIPRKMGMAAKATIGDLVYAILTSNPVLSDGKALFHADHKNLQTGASSALSIESLSKAKTQMATQKTEVEGGKPRTLNIRPAFVLTPVALEDKAKQIIRSASVPGAESNSGIENPIRNFAEVIGEPRLDDNSATAYYLAARQGSDTIEVAYLDGNELPYMEQQQGFTVDGVATKVRIDAGVAPLDFRGLQKSNGA
ncbi:ClpP-like prohead protease/major capsid protein fusion protein [Pseudomonas aeruginosa]|uniref:ClpP-like prohead protease/major capsid protein fusion protein n=2 Tax=Pseudomonas aeruginosa TaxID=287 RepID=UPI0002FF9DEB|nr:ClpP-like prohead protease/major capsid protein fusion protein [Pseudomonas aeruginosa]AHK81751.1 peptidase S14 [Pseudomonas aeruginosa LESlike5]AHK93577.1 peptidase S14 [Pseudomonas aeruginosa LES400]AHK99593.1 peptidase S14 [Pseudomonas aeruginosa LESB65]AHL05546.1 peptidase S14 [Pseudomonas aeruginosa LESlike1]AHL11476.1 peptidase S14 [Pseudomonas aeruginosa LESlike4]